MSMSVIIFPYNEAMLSTFSSLFVIYLRSNIKHSSDEDELCLGQHEILFLIEKERNYNIYIHIFQWKYLFHYFWKSGILECQKCGF